MAAWLGLVPRQATTGGKPRLLGITKRGNAYLRTLLIHGARATLLDKPDADGRMASRSHRTSAQEQGRGGIGKILADPALNGGKPLPIEAFSLSALGRMATSHPAELAAE